MNNIKKIISSIVLSVFFFSSNFQNSAKAMTSNEENIKQKISYSDSYLNFAHSSGDPCDYMNAAIEYYTISAPPNSTEYDYSYMKYCEAIACAYKMFAFQHIEELDSWKISEEKFTQAYLIAQKLNREDEANSYYEAANFAKAQYETLYKKNERLASGKSPYTEKQTMLLLSSISSVSSQDENLAEQQNSSYCKTSALYSSTAKVKKKKACCNCKGM